MSTKFKRLLTAILLLASFQLQAAQELVTYYVSDALGSTIAAFEHGSATLKWRQEHQAYGVRKNKDVTIDNPLGFARHMESADTHLVYMGARWYDPEIGRFMGIDSAPLDLADYNTYNRYMYANNNPYKYIDPNGESPLDALDFAIDSYKLYAALQTGIGIPQATADFAASAVGLASPLPGAGRLIKVGMAARNVTKGAKIAKDVVLSGGRSGSKVKSLTGPANSAVKGNNGRVFVTDDKGRVVLDITKNRVKPVTPGKGFGSKRAPTQQEIDLVNKIHGGS